jgi:predicted acetylornithine/succinylornithine family transaminase
MNAQEIFNAAAQYLVPTYVRPPVLFTRGQGCYLYDSDGRQYLDFAAGIAVNALGHSDPEWAAAVAEQARTLTHVSNLFHSAPQVELARRLVENSFAARVFFCNSGAEANEGALKLARKWGRTVMKVAGTKQKIVAFEHSFHGRTMGALSVTAKAQYREPFAPLLPGVTFVPFNDLAAAAAAIDEETCAVIIEPVQGEGGVHAAAADFLRGLRRLCDHKQALLIFDEVQCGLGRTGQLWAHQAYGVTPDIMTLAKPLAGGLPIGAILVTEEVGQLLQPGDHGSTFAGGPLVCRAAQVVFDRVSRPEFLEAVRRNGRHLSACLESLGHEHIVDVRGAGLLVGVELAGPVKPLLTAAAARGLILINAGENVLRLAPPLVVSREQIDFAVAVIGKCLNQVKEATNDTNW